MRTCVYPAKFERGDKSGVLVVTFRDVPEAITQGNGERDALWQAADCLEEAIAGRIADGREIPKASRAARRAPDPLPAPIRSGAYLAMEEAGMTNAVGAKARLREKECGGCRSQAPHQTAVDQRRARRVWKVWSSGGSGVNPRGTPPPGGSQRGLRLWGSQPRRGNWRGRR